MSEPIEITVTAGSEERSFTGFDPGLLVMQASQAMAQALDAGLHPDFDVTSAQSDHQRIQLTAALDHTLEELVKHKNRVLH